MYVISLQEETGRNIDNQKDAKQTYQSSIISIYSPTKVFKLLVNLAGENAEEKWNAPSKYETAINGVLAGNREYLNAIKARLKNEADPYDPHDFNVSYAIADALEEVKLKSWEDRLRSLEKLTDLYKFFMNATLRNEIKEEIKESLIYANKLIDVMKEMYESNKQNREDANLRKLKISGNRELLKTYYSLKKRITVAFSRVYGEVYAQEEDHTENKGDTPSHERIEEKDPSNESETKKEDGNGNGTGSGGNTLENFPIYQIAAKIAEYAETKTIPKEEEISQLTEKYINTLEDSEKEALIKLMEGLKEEDKEQAYQGLKELFEALYNINQHNKTTERKDAVRFLSAIAYSLEYVAGRFNSREDLFQIYASLIKSELINEKDLTNLYRNKTTFYKEIFNELSTKKESEHYNKYRALLESDLINFLKKEDKPNDKPDNKTQVVQDTDVVVKDNKEKENETSLEQQLDPSNVEDAERNKENADGKMDNDDNGGSGSGNDDENNKKKFLSAVWEKIKNNPGKSALFGLALLAALSGGVLYKHFSNRQAEIYKYLNNPKKIEIFTETDFQKFINSLIPQQEWEEVLSKNFDKINKNPNPQRVIELLNEAGYNVERVVKAKIENSEVWWLKGKTEKTYRGKEIINVYRELLERDTGYAIFEVKTSQYEGIAAIPLGPYLKGDNSKPIIWFASVIKKSHTTYETAKKPKIEKKLLQNKKGSSKDVCEEKPGIFGNLGRAWDKLFNLEENHDPFFLP